MSLKDVEAKVDELEGRVAALEPAPPVEEAVSQFDAQSRLRDLKFDESFDEAEDAEDESEDADEDESDEDESGDEEQE